jgi:dihydrofolate reductase
LNAQLIDEFYFAIHPILLGRGAPLFLPCDVQTNLELISAKTFANQAVMLHYRRTA